MSKSNAFENDLLKLIFNAVGIADLADNDASSPATNLYVSFHTADPGEAGDQSTSEASYTSYARVAVARNSSGWVITGNTVNPAAPIQAPASTGGSTTPITHWGVGTKPTTAGYLLYKGALSGSITMAAGIAPQLTTATAITEE